MTPDARIYLTAFYSVSSEFRDSADGETREWFGWRLTPMEGRRYLCADEDVYKFSTHAAAVRYAEGWIKINRPDLVRAAEAEATEARRYQAAHRHA